MLLKFSSHTTDPEFQPIRLFLSYSHKDEVFKQTLEEHLYVLKRQGFIDSWNDRKIRPGDEWRNKIDDNLERSRIILLLISSSFISSDYCFDVEMKRALEKHHSSEAVVIPVIIRPVFWKILPLAELQAVPKDAKPITSWSNQDEAFTDVAEHLRTVIASLNEGSISISDEMRWRWILQLDDVGQSISKISEKIVSRMREISGDSGLKLVALAEEKNIIVFDGSKEGFHVVEALFKSNRLQEQLGYPIHTFYIAYGASIQSSSKLISEENIDVNDVDQTYDELVYKSKQHVPILLKGLFVPSDTLLNFEFTIDSGHDKSDPTFVEDESKKLAGYFLSSLAVKSEDLWVNLSEYESNRMIPEVLSGTQLGRDMLAQDCVLKQLTASLLHPDTEIGRSYWQTVNRRAFKLFGTSNIPVTSYHKVWLQPCSATVFETDLPANFDDNDSDVLKSVANKTGRFVLIVEARMIVKCEEDYYAIKANLKPEELEGGSRIPCEIEQLHNFTIPIFREIVLPEIEDEINNGINFCPIRQIYHSLVLAKWFKQEFSERTEYKSLVDTNKPHAYQPTFLKIQPIGDQQSKRPDSSALRLPRKVIGLNTSDIPENREFHAIYSRLFKRGLFRVARREIDLHSEKVVTRIYFSGKIDLLQINLSNSLERPFIQEKNYFLIGSWRKSG